MSINPATIGFKPEFLDFTRGIRVGHLQPHERITRLLKLALEIRFDQPFVTVRWGRGVHWPWIGFFPKADRQAKPISHHVNFGCAKYFISLDSDQKLFKAGMQVERGYLRAPREYPECRLREDWDWHRLLAQMKSNSELDTLLLRLVRGDGFRLYAGGWGRGNELSAKSFKGVGQLRRMLAGAPAADWCGFQLFYPMREKEVRQTNGVEIIESILAIFSEVTPVMNASMQVSLSCGPSEVR